MSIVTCRSQLSRGALQLLPARPDETLFNYVGGPSGSWRVTKVVTHAGLALKSATHVEISHGNLERVPAKAAWMLRGVVSNTRYVTREERPPLAADPWMSPPAEATCAALIPIRKSSAWWSLARDRRLELLDLRSRQMSSRFRFLPAIAKRLQFSRNLGEQFDFVTWFEYAPQDAAIFDELAAVLRSSEAWKYVEREIDIRLIREAAV